jgi:hypothetical protein
MKYKGKEYCVRDSYCKKLINICFIPYSGNGTNICRKWELGQCPTIEEINNIKIEQKNKTKQHTDNCNLF